MSKVALALALGFWSLAAMMHAAVTGWIMLAAAGLKMERS